jgi:hypothetical protein
MKVSEVQRILDEACQFYRSQGNERVAEGLSEFAKLLDGYDGLTMDALLKRIAARRKLSAKLCSESVGKQQVEE